MAKRKKLPNTTRALHKQTLERAVMLQNAAMRQPRELDFLSIKDSGDDAYMQVVKIGQHLLDEDILIKNPNYNIVKSYYSRADVQSAMYNYAKGRKISVLRHFKPMFAGSTLRKPEDILPIMMYYSREMPLWPSMHGTVSRHDENHRLVCDLVIEVDAKKSRVKCFTLTRPLIKIFTDLDIEFRIKYSGNSSAHVIIPGEAFPENYRRGGNCRYLYSQLLEFFKKQIREPNLLDRSFRNSNHFLRLAYSLNENTGLASIPIRLDDYDRFSWQSANPDSVVVLDDWWQIPDDAPEKIKPLLDFVIGEKRSFVVSDTDTRPIRTETALQKPELIGKNNYMGMVKAGEEAIRRYQKISSSIDPASTDEMLIKIREAIANNNGLRDVIKDLSERYNIGKDDLLLLWRWSNKSKAIAYYERKDIQESIYSYAMGRCVSMGDMDEFFAFECPFDVFHLAVYAVSDGINPSFYCTNAKYDVDDGKMIACDIVVEIDQADMNFINIKSPCFVLYDGDNRLRIVIPHDYMKTLCDIEHAISDLPSFRENIRKSVRDGLGLTRHASIYMEDVFFPIPYSATDDCERVNLPIMVSDLSFLSNSMVDISNIQM